MDIDQLSSCIRLRFSLRGRGEQLRGPGVIYGRGEPHGTRAGLRQWSDQCNFMVQEQAESPSFFVFGGGPYVAATHANGCSCEPLTSIYEAASCFAG
jgi:hypothetical protein